MKFDMGGYALQFRVEPSIPPGQKAKLGGDEGPASVRYRDATSGLGLFIEYVDAHGEPSMRRIACKYFDPGHQTIQAWCFERMAPRQFRLDRIVSAACTETGEVLDVPSLIQALRSKGMPSDDPRLPRLLNVLVFLMRCDGLHPREMEALESAVTSYALRFDGDDATVEQGMRLAHTLAPDGTDFIRTFRWMKTRRDKTEIARFLRHHAAAVIEADGVQSEDEVRFGVALGEELTKLCRD